MHITISDLLQVTDTVNRFSQLTQDLEDANKTISVLQNEVKKLYKEILDLKAENDLQSQQLVEETFRNTNLMETNKAFRNYVEKLCGISVNTEQEKHKEFSEVSRSYQLKVLRQIKSRAQCALWFLDCFGLKLDLITLKENTENQHDINYNPTETEQDVLKKVLYLLDRFYVSDACYHELSVICKGLPKSYLVKQLRKDMNTIMSCPENTWSRSRC